MPYPPRPDPERYCTHCAKRLARKRFNGRIEDMAVFARRKYCDQICMARGMVKERVQRNTYRQRARRYRKNMCERCGSPERLEVHHKDRDVSNNDPSNLETLCDSCHMKGHWASPEGLYPIQRRSCKVCGEPVKCHYLCLKHYQRWKKYGDPLLTKKKIDNRWVIVPAE